MNNKCLSNDTLVVLCYALFCIGFGLIVAALVNFLDRKRSKKEKSEIDTSKGAQRKVGLIIVNNVRIKNAFRCLKTIQE